MRNDILSLVSAFLVAFLCNIGVMFISTVFFDDPYFIAPLIILFFVGVLFFATSEKETWIYTLGIFIIVILFTMMVLPLLGYDEAGIVY